MVTSLVGRLFPLTAPAKAESHALTAEFIELHTGLPPALHLSGYPEPKFELHTGRVSCLEALVRWQHPERGLLLPSEFLSVAEQYSELIGPMTSWVLRRALADCTTWTDAGHHWAVAVNLSHRNLTSLEFAETVNQMLRESGVRPRLLHLEVTETALADDNEMAAQVVGALAAQGVSISMDNFGVGFTSLTQLRTVQLSEVKINGAFFADLPGDDKDRAVVRSFIDLGHSLGCLVTAVGVESQDVSDALVDAGCDQAQGYLWAHPCPWEDVARAFGTPTASTASSATDVAAMRGTPTPIGPGSE